MKAIIADDEEMSRKLIKQFADRTGMLDVKGVYSNVLEIRELIKEESIDIVFLDIEMPGMSGIDLLRSTEIIPQVILTTNHKEFALEAFEYDITDYLAKPINYARFLKAIQKAFEIHKTKKSQQETTDEERKELFVKLDYRMVKINVDDILYIEAYGDYVKIYQPGKKYLVNSTLTNIERSLSSRQFIRVHRRYVVRLDKISEIRKNSVLITDIEIPVSKSYKAELMESIRFIR